MISKPLVTVVCLSYNQAQWLEEAIQSVLDQTYPNIQLILLDDASTDDSPARIKSLAAGIDNAEVILLTQNVGNCAAFNAALPHVRGKYVIDFSADDVMVADRISRQVELFESLPPDVGVVFTDADIIDATGKVVRTHFGYLRQIGLVTRIPEGDVFRDILTTYFIASPTMMVRKEVFDRLGGYDERLAYEDFDFWVRSSRLYRYALLPEKLTKIRKSPASMSSGWYRIGDRQLHSTYLVCRKAVLLCRDSGDEEALIRRIRYELRQAVFSENREEAGLFYELLNELSGKQPVDVLLWMTARSRIPLAWMRAIYYRWRFR